MGWLTFISKTIDSLAWPIVALILGLIVRRKLLDLIPSISRLKAGPIEAEFELATKQLLANAAAAGVQSQPQSEKSPLNGQISGDPEIVAKLISARGDPAGMILEGWATVDGELFRFGHQMGMVSDSLENTAKVYQDVMATDLLPFEVRRLVRELKELRDKVAHVEVKPKPDAAQDYLLAVDRVVQLINTYRKNLANYGPANR